MRRSFRRAKREMIWTQQTVDSVGVNSAATTSGDIVVAADWSAVFGFAKGAVLERIRGNISLETIVTAASSQRAWMAIFKLNDAETVPDPTAPATYETEDVLWQYIWSTRGQATNPAPQQLVVDVKARRKLDTNSRITFAFRGTGTSNVIGLTAIFRGLVSKP